MPLREKDEMKMPGIADIPAQESFRSPVLSGYCVPRVPPKTPLYRSFATCAIGWRGAAAPVKHQPIGAFGHVKASVKETARSARPGRVIVHPVNEGRNVNGGQHSFFEGAPHIGRIPFGGFAHPLNGAADAHQSWNLDMDMSGFQLAADHLPGGVAIRMKSAQPRHDQSMQPVTRR